MISNAIKLQPTFESCGLITHLTRYILHCNLIHMLQLPATPQISAKCQLLQKTKTTSCIILELFLPKIKYTKEWTDLQARTTTNRLQILFAAPRRLMAICHALQIKLVMDGWMDDMDEGRMDQLRMYTSYIYRYMYTHTKKYDKNHAKIQKPRVRCINLWPHDISKDTALWWCWWPCIGTPAAYGALCSKWLQFNGGNATNHTYSNTTPSPK